MLAKFLNQLDDNAAYNVLEKCCGATAWIEAMIGCRPFENEAAVIESAKNCWNSIDRESRLEAFSAHPRIGNVDSLRAKYANTNAWATEEQAGVTPASDEILQPLAHQNDAYFDKFGYMFIVCATGKSAAKMLEIIESRLPNEPDTEFLIASDEQLKITLLRLRKLSQNE